MSETPLCRSIGHVEAEAILREMETVAADCEEMAFDAQRDGDKGLSRAMCSVAYRIRYASQKMLNT